MLVIRTSAPAIAAPCSSVTVPRTEPVKFCARVAREVLRMSARTTSSEKLSRDLHVDSFTFKNRIFIRLPLEEILRKTESTKSARIRLASDSMFYFTPSNIREKPKPLKHYRT